jgi:hypothetical protein
MDTQYILSKPENDGVNNDLLDPTTNHNVNETTKTTRSGRQIKKPSYMQDYAAYESNIFEFDNTSSSYTDSTDPCVRIATNNQDNFYYHDILREPDRDTFITAMLEKIDNHNKNNNWMPVLRSELPPGVKVLPSVWKMQRKRQLTDVKIHKQKARLNVNGSKKMNRSNFWENYAPSD